MSESHVVSALRLRRAEISGHIHDLEKRIARQRANLANLDATIMLFAPGANPDSIPPKRTYRRTRYFARHELSRFTMDTLRLAPAPIMAGQIADAVMRAKNLPAEDPALKATVTDMVLAALRRHLKRGDVVKTGVSRDARWAVAPSFL